MKVTLKPIRNAGRDLIGYEIEADGEYQRFGPGANGLPLEVFANWLYSRQVAADAVPR